MKYKKLFEPITIGKAEINNRIAMAPMGIGGLIDENGGLTQRALDYYQERAIGGVGLIITGLVKGSDKLEPRYGVNSLNRKTASSFAELAETVHYHGSKVFIQLTVGFGRAVMGRVIDRGDKPISASAVPAYFRPNVTTREITIDEIQQLVADMGKSARLAREVGLDGVELHAHEGYLFDQFATALWNKRTDRYGGDLKGRLTFATEVLTSIKNAAGADFPVVYRYGLKHYMKAPWAPALRREGYVEAGRDVPEGVEMAGLLEMAGFDALHVDAGCYDSWYWPHPPVYQPHGCMVDMAAEARKAVSIPIIAVGRLDEPDLAETVLREGKADMVAIGRGLLADPHWPLKVHQGRVGDITPCTGCHDGCLNRMLTELKTLSCAVNPSTGRERLNVLRPVGKPARVMVVGGGVAGMEAARVSALRGCTVTLYEKTAKLGGHVLAACVPDFKGDYRRLLNWYRLQLKQTGVTVHLNSNVTAALVRKEKPDRVVIATGSTPCIPDLPGIDRPSVVTCSELLLGKKTPGAAVAVIGGGLVGCETALWLAGMGKKVTIVEMLPEMAPGVFDSNRSMLLDLLQERKVDLLNNTTLEAVNDGSIAVAGKDTDSRTIECDTVALAAGLQSRRELWEALRREVADIYLVGDSKKPRKVYDAIWDGYYAASR